MEGGRGSCKNGEKTLHLSILSTLFLETFPTPRLMYSSWFSSLLRTASNNLSHYDSDVSGWEWGGGKRKEEITRAYLN